MVVYSSVNPIKGYVYIVQPIGHNVYKIGCTIDLERRLKRMMSTYGFKLEYVAYHRFEDYQAAEAWFHEHFRKKRLRSDWFLLTAEDIEYFKNLDKES
jgi:predicted GIY-YIG superfamily endonuclease